MRVVLRGRSAEMAAAIGPLRRAMRTGRGGMLLVTGEPGIGKSALPAAVAGEAGTLGFRVGAAAVVRPAPGEADRAGGGRGVEALLLALRSGPDPLLSSGELAELSSLTPVLLADRAASLLADRAGASPVLVVVDDLQWAGPACLATLQALAGRLAGQPVVWALGSRRTSRDFLRGLGEAGPHGLHTHWVRPGPLAGPDVTALARDRLGHEPDGALRHMLAGSGGNPRLIVEVIEGLAQAAARGEPTDRIPSALVRTVRRFMTRLGQGPREVAEVAAVLGRPLSAGEACALLPGQAEADVAGSIDRGIAAGLLSESGHAVRVRFDLIREAIYGDLPPARRAGLHLRCGRYLAAAGDPRAAAGHDAAALRVADLALARTDDLAERATLQVLAARALATLGQPAGALARIRAAGPGGPPRARAQLAAAEALARARSGPEAAARMAVVRALAARRAAAGPGTASGPEPGAASDAGDKTTELVVAQALAEVSRLHGRADDALRHARALRQLAGADHPAYLADEVLALQQADRLTEADLLLGTAGQAAGAWPGLVVARIWQELALGRLAEAEASALALAELGRALGRPADQLAKAAELVITRLRGPAGAGHNVFKMGEADHDEAARWRSAVRAGREQGAAWLWQPGTMRLAAQLGLAAGDRDLVEEAAAVAELAAARNPGIPVFGGLACQVRGVARGDASLLGRAWKILRASPRPLVAASAAQDYGAALLTAPGPGSRAAGVRLLDHAWDGFDQAGAGAARYAVERTLRQAGIRRAKWTARPAGPEGPGPGWHALTDAELKVAELVSSGHTNRSAASQLGLSPNTVGTHVRSIFSKLHIQSRVQLANLRHQQLAGAGAGVGLAAAAQPPARILRAVWAISALVNACPAMPQPPSGASEISTQVRSASDGSPAAAAVISVISRTTPSFLSRSSTPTGVSTAIRTWVWSPLALLSESGASSCTNAAVLSAKNGMSGTASQRIMQAARSWASLCLSLNVPVAAVTSIIGMVVAPRLLTRAVSGSMPRHRRPPPHPNR